MASSLNGLRVGESTSQSQRSSPPLVDSTVSPAHTETAALSRSASSFPTSHGYVESKIWCWAKVPKYEYYRNILKLYFNLRGLLVRRCLFCIQHPPMLNKFLLHAWRYCGGLDVEHSILVYWRSNSFWHAKKILNEFGPQ